MTLALRRDSCRRQGARSWSSVDFRMLPACNSFQVPLRRGGRLGSVRFPALSGLRFHCSLARAAGPFSCCSNPPVPFQAEASLGVDTARVRSTTSGRDTAPMEMRALELMMKWRPSTGSGDLKR